MERSEYQRSKIPNKLHSGSSWLASQIPFKTKGCSLLLAFPSPSWEKLITAVDICPLELSEEGTTYHSLKRQVYKWVWMRTIQTKVDSRWDWKSKTVGIKSNLKHRGYSLHNSLCTNLLGIAQITRIILPKRLLDRALTLSTIWKAASTELSRQKKPLTAFWSTTWTSNDLTHHFSSPKFRCIKQCPERFQLTRRKVIYRMFASLFSQQLPPCFLSGIKG